MRNWIWFLPPELMPAVATILVMVGGFALAASSRFAGARPFAITCLVIGILLLTLPVLDPVIDEAVGSSLDAAEYALAIWPWWLIAIVGGFGVLLLLGWIVAMIFNREVADHMVGSLLAGAIVALVRAPLRAATGLLRLFTGGRG